MRTQSPNTTNGIRDLTGLKQPRLGAAIQAVLKTGRIRETIVERANKQKYGGYELVPNVGKVRHSDDSDSLGENTRTGWVTHTLVPGLYIESPGTGGVFESGRRVTGLLIGPSDWADESILPARDHAGILWEHRQDG